MSLPTEDEFYVKLIKVFKKITLGSKPIENNYLQRILQIIEQEYGHKTYLKLPGLSDWLTETLQLWKNNHPSIPVTVFICDFINILCKKEEGFMFVEEFNVLEDLSSVVHPVLHNNHSLQVAYIKLLTDIQCHNSAYTWLINSEQWKIVIDLYFCSSNFYVEREAISFFKKFMWSNPDKEIIAKVFQEILIPLTSVSVAPNTDFNKITLTMCLLQEVLKYCIESNIHTNYEILVQSLDIEICIKSIIENCKQESTLSTSSSLLIVFYMLKSQKFKDQLATENILKIFFILLEMDYINVIVKLAKFCQILYSQQQLKPYFNDSGRIQYTIFQLIPILSYKTSLESEYSYGFVEKLLEIMPSESCYFAQSFRAKLKTRNNIQNCILKSLLLVTSNMEYLSQREAVLIYQSLVYVLNTFIGDTSSNSYDPMESATYDDEDTLHKYKRLKKESVSAEDMSILSANLCAVHLLLTKFQITETESSESICLLKLCCDILQSTHYPSSVLIQTLSVVKLLILNSVSSNFELLVNSNEDSNFSILLFLIYKHMYNPSWEIRDSCIEIVTTITQFAESKYPNLQNILIKNGFPSLLCSILEGDSESYVRASALRGLTSMAKIYDIRFFLNTLQMPCKVIQLLQNETEGIVRREAALFIKEIHLYLNKGEDIENSIYEIMNFTALCDLHWEVKVNSLQFWEQVIYKVFEKAGMIDGSFSEFKLSQEDKKIIPLSTEKIKIRIKNVLEELSKIGCLNVLLNTLNDDCDFQVVSKTAEILLMLTTILRKYHILEPSYDSVSYITSPKKPNQKTFKENKEICLTESVKVNDNVVNTRKEPDAVIEEIVNDMDINLLLQVQQSQEKPITIKQKTMIKEIKPELFIKEMQNLEISNFLENKRKWLTNAKIDLNYIINDIMAVNPLDEANIMDCY